MSDIDKDDDCLQVDWKTGDISNIPRSETGNAFMPAGVTFVVYDPEKGGVWLEDISKKIFLSGALIGEINAKFDKRHD